MLLNPARFCNNKPDILVPKGMEISGPFSDQVARFVNGLLIKTSCRDEYRKGFFVSCSNEFCRRQVGNWSNVKKTLISKYDHVFEWNERYSNFKGNTFCKSVRLKDAFRTGHTELYTFKRKQKPWSRIDLENLDAVSQRLLNDFQYFWLPETKPEFSNPWQELAWDCIDAKDYYASRCEFGRFHSNFTSFKHRALLEHNHPLIALDITNCQPLILGILATQRQTADRYYHKWLEDCNKGLIYDRASEYLCCPRQLAKEQVITAMFNKAETMVQSPVFQWITREYPTIAAYLTETKNIGGHQEVAHRCQRLESRILIDTVAKSLPSVNMITVHDEFIIPEHHVDRVTRIILKSFSRFGVVPTIRAKSLVA